MKAVGGNDIWAWAGVRSDPFFFDLTGFIGTTTFLTTGTAVGGDALGSDPTDFFAVLNTNAIVLSIPNSQLPDTIGVWATTSWYDGSTWQAADQMGRPAINTVFNPAADKNAFNTTAPSAQATAMGGKFRTNVINGLTSSPASIPRARTRPTRPGSWPRSSSPTSSSTAGRTPSACPRRSTAGRSPTTSSTSSSSSPPVAIPLNLFGADGLTGLGPDRDGSGAVNGDGVGPHADYLASFPYLGVPH